MTITSKDQREGRPWDAIPATGPILRPAEAAAYIGLSKARYYESAAKGLLPSPILIGARATGVPQPWLDAVISDRVLASGGAL